MTDPRDERFSIDLDPEDALRALLQTGDEPPRVAIIVSEDAASRLASLAHQCPVWVLQTSESAIAVQRARESGGNVTTFVAERDSEDTLLSILSEVELHHGPDSGEQPVGILEIVGATPSEAIRDELRALGFGRLESSPDGFLAYRQP